MAKTAKPKVKIVQDETAEKVPAKIIAQSIKQIADAVRAFDRSGLSEKAIVLLLSHSSSQSQHTVKTILRAMRDLEKDYLK